MPKVYYTLSEGEKIILQNYNVWCEGISGWTDQLILTNYRIIHLHFNIWGIFKKIYNIKLEDITHVIIGHDKNENKQLVVFHNGDGSAFTFPDLKARTVKIWKMAIEDRFTENADLFDYDYYQNLTDDNLEKIYRQNERSKKTEMTGKAILGDIAKNVIKSGKINPMGVAQGIAKTGYKFSSNTSDYYDSDDSFKTLFKDEFEDIGNEFREALGLGRKTTRREKKEEDMDAIFEAQRRNLQKEILLKKKAMQDLDKNASKEKESTNPNGGKPGIDEQIAIVKKLKELLDCGAITQEEFEKKKKEVMSL